VTDPQRALRELERLRTVFDNGSARAKLGLLRIFERGRLRSADQVLRLHEILCFLRAYPDDAAVLAQVESMLSGFPRRSDLRRHRGALADTGIAGTAIYYRFFWPTARWIAHRWPERLHIDWPNFTNHDKLQEVLPLLVPFVETDAMDELDYTAREWVDLLRGPNVTDATFLVRRIEALAPDDYRRELIHDSIDFMYRFDPGPDTPARTHGKVPVAQVFHPRGPLQPRRPVLAREVRRPPVAVRAFTPRAGQELIDLARSAMVTRSRDLDVFAYGDPNDVRVVEFGQGLQFVCIGFVPERRTLLHAVYGFLTLKNGVPIGYVLSSALAGTADVAYNVFDTYRGTEAALVFSRVLAMVHHVFGVREFSIDPYQLGYDNTEGQKSGAWWFYYKLGFRPRDPAVRRVLRGELQSMRRDPRHRSTRATLQQLAAEPMYWNLSAGRASAELPWPQVGLQVSKLLARRFGADRERGVRACMREASARTGLRSMRSFTRAERLAWERWSPIVAALPGLERWSPAEKRALVAVVRAKGGRYESHFVRLFDRHARLRRAVLRLASRDAGE
jgi:hypothetical protein